MKAAHAHAPEAAAAVDRFRALFGPQRPLVAMIHLAALPGSPGYGGSVDALVERALAEADTYVRAGVPALMLENMHDTPYLRGGVGPECVAAACAAACAVRRAHPRLPVGLQLLAAANREALAVALAAGLDFVRAEGFVFAHVADEGILESCAGELLRYRRAVGAERVLIFADIKKKHSAHAITADVGIGETAEAAAFFGADGAIVTGAATGRAASPADVTEAAESGLPILVGSGVTPENVARFDRAAGFIVGSYFKRDGFWRNELDPPRIERFLAALAEAEAGR